MPQSSQSSYTESWVRLPGDRTVFDSVEYFQSSVISLNAQLFQVTFFAINELYHGTRYCNCSKHRADNTNHQGNGKAFDRTCTNREQNERHQEGGQVRVENGVIGTVITGHDRLFWRRPPFYFFPYSFTNQYVGIDRHTDGNDDTGNTRKGQGSTNPGHDCQNHRQVKDQRKVSNHTKHTEEYHHPDGNQKETDLS